MVGKLAYLVRFLKRAWKRLLEEERGRQGGRSSQPLRSLEWRRKEEAEAAAYGTRGELQRRDRRALRCSVSTVDSNGGGDLDFRTW